MITHAFSTSLVREISKLVRKSEELYEYNFEYVDQQVSETAKFGNFESIHVPN